MKNHLWNPVWKIQFLQGVDRQMLRRESMIKGTISGYLEEDHIRIEDALRRASSAPDLIDPAAYVEFRGALLRHIGLEEKILLPAARAANKGQTVHGADQLHLDHGALAALLVLTPTTAIIRRIRGILDGHNKIEEGSGGVYAQCEQLLGPNAGQILARLKAAAPVAMAAYSDNETAVASMHAALRRAGYSSEV